jgi:carbamoyl-phosphate synthase large subunit
VLTAIIERERPDALLPTLGGQTALNLTMALVERGVLDAYGVEVIGANAPRPSPPPRTATVQAAMEEIGLEVPSSGFAHSLDEAMADRGADRLPDHGPAQLHPRRVPGRASPPTRPSWPDWPPRAWPPARSRRSWSSGRSPDGRSTSSRSCATRRQLRGRLLHRELRPMGVHTGDSITVAPAQTLTDVEYQAMRDDAFACIRRVGVETGGSNVQFAVDPPTGRQVVIEMNPRVSRSSALASKATGFPIAKIAARLAVGYHARRDHQRHHRATPVSRSSRPSTTW